MIEARDREDPEQVEPEGHAGGRPGESRPDDAQAGHMQQHIRDRPDPVDPVLFIDIDLGTTAHRQSGPARSRRGDALQFAPDP